MTELRDRLQATLHGSYTLDRELGGGGMSRVFVAEELRLGRRVVVKVLSPELAAGISAERFEREIRMAASLQQANIVPVLATGETDGLPFYTMPYVEGQSLRARLGGDSALPTSDVLRILGDVARALQYAHDRGVVHRDIKPDNVLLSGGTAVVTDFGIAKAISASRKGGADGADGAGGATLTQVGTSIGTPAYMAPEQAAGDPDIDHRADLYAFGCLAYELLTGQPPFAGRTPQRVLAAQLAEQPAPLAGRRPDLPAPLLELVMRCLAKEAHDRPQTAGEVIAALNTVTSGSGMPALPPVLLHGPRALRRALAVYAACVVGVALVAQAATVVIGLPGWVLSGALVVMALGLPVILFTGYVQRVARRALQATPVLTPGGGQPRQGTMATLALRASPHVSWQRATRGGVYALGTFAALVVGYMVLRAFGIGPAGSLLAAGRLEARERLLITDFAVHGADSSVANVVAEGVRVSLGQSPTVTLMSATEVASALGRMELPPTSRVDLALARQVAAREGVRAVVDGDVTALGSGFVVALRLVATEDGAVLARHRSGVDSPTALIEGVDALARELRAHMGESLRSVRASAPLQRVTTASLPALRLYTQAVRIFDVEKDFARAIPLLREAVAADTGFAMAWRKLAVALNNENFPRSAVDSAMAQAYRWRERLPDRERHLTEGSYYHVGPGRDRAKAIAAFQAQLRAGDSAGSMNNLASQYRSRREYAAAESLFRAEIRRPGGFAGARLNLGLVLEQQGRFAEADSVIDAVGQAFPNDAMVPLLQGLRLTRAARYDDFERRLDSLRAPGMPAGARLYASYGALWVGQLRGRLGEIERLYPQILVMERALGASSQLTILDSLDLIELDVLFRSAGDRAVRRLDATLAAHPLARLPEVDRPYARTAVLYAQAGRPDRARAVLAQRLAELTDTALVRWQAPEVHQALGEIALAEGRPLEAVTNFRRGDQRPDGPWEGSPLVAMAALGRAYDQAGMADSAIASFERYLATPDLERLGRDQSYLAGIRKRLGELYEARGEWPRAAEHYAAFVELWKGADPDLQPVVAEVRRRLARGSDVPRP